LIEERGSVEVFCEFCGQEYQFDQVDVGRIFAANPIHLPDISGVH
jgi:molecular chaperone Hsp33